MEVRLALDTNRLTDALAGRFEAVSVVEAAEEVYVPFIVLGEIRAGFLGGNPKRRANNESLLQDFLRQPGVATLYPDEGTVQAYAELADGLRQIGKPIPTNDLWIGALALQHRLSIYSRDGHFANLKRITLIS